MLPSFEHAPGNVLVAVQSIFKMADKDMSDAIDWSEFSNLLVVNVSNE
jgi:hypothetical protein